MQNLIKQKKRQRKTSETTASKSNVLLKIHLVANTTNKNAQGDGQGTAAIGNLIKGRGTKSGSQGN